MKLAPNGCSRNERFREAEKCKAPPQWILCAAPMNFGSRRESLMAEIRNSTTRLNRNCKKQTNKQSQNSRFGGFGAAKELNVIHLLGLQLYPLPNSSEASDVSSRQEAYVHRPRRRTGPAFWKYAA